ncbi:MAG: hypothetical protein HUU60_12600 [Armatimonadetes bacterium]|nr:hypothetical protein [Armatimonadota bacterium]
MSLNWNPHRGQRAFLANDSKPIKVLACGRRWGKTEVAALELAKGLMAKEDARAILVAPTLAQGMETLDRAEMALVREGANFYRKTGQSPGLYSDKRRLLLKAAARQGLALRGFRADMAVVDEAAYVPEEVVVGALMPTLAERRGRLICISTPRGRNYFHRLWERGQSGDPEVWSLTSPSWENPNLSAPFLASQAKLMSHRDFMVEYGAEFLDSGKAAFRTDWIDRATLMEPDVEGPVVAGIDWARYRDYTAAVVLQGSRAMCRMVGLQRWRGQSWGFIVAEAAAYLAQHNVEKAICDSTGSGDAVMEQLVQRAPCRTEGIVFTRQSKRRLVDQLALGLEQGRIALLPDQELLRELYHFELLGDDASAGFGAQPGFNDDLAIALCLAYEALPTHATARLLLAGRRD